MTTTEKIIDELSNAEKSLSTPLLKTKIIASRIKNDELLEWTSNELKGYKHKDLPHYRLAKCNLTCSLHQGIYREDNVPLPIMLFPKQMIDEMTNFRLEDGVQSLENNEKENKNGIIYKDFGADMAAYLTKIIQESGQDLRITNLKMTVHLSQVTQTLSAIREKLLDFMLQIEQEFPNLDELIKSHSTEDNKISERVEKIYYQTIINTSGDGNTITTGNKNTIKSKVKINKGNIDELKEELRKLNVNEIEIEEISEIIKTEAPDKDNQLFGEKTNDWIQKMISRTLDGSWKLATGTASTLLIELLKNYYGI